MEKSMAVLEIALPVPLRKLFDYLPPQGLDYSKLIPGARVKVPFGARTLVGVLISVKKKSDLPYDKLKSALEVLDVDSIYTDDVYQLCQWAAEYYHYPLGEVLATAMPVWLRKGKICVDAHDHRAVLDKTAPAISRHIPVSTLDFSLNSDQQDAIAAIHAAQSQFAPFLLDGVTGSGKTEVYLQAIEKIIAAGQQALVLVPEISLTPQTIARFQKRFADSVMAVHSAMTDKQRFVVWQAARSGEVKIVIGTRSAIFIPFAHLGLIIVDEEHDSSFKQHDRFRYHARDLAVMRAHYNQIPVVLGSATPSLESLLNAKKERYQQLVLSERAGNAKMPAYQLIDMQKEQEHDGLSQQLLDAMQAELDAGNQVMLFLNKRGFAPVYYCCECSYIVECKRCDAKMVYHQSPKRLQCHHCNAQRAIPKQCDQCHMQNMQPLGLGTQRLEETLTQRFKDVPIIRVDRDSTRKKGAIEELLESVQNQPKAILLGTQMLAKGHHFPNVTLVGVIDADAGLFSADFRAAEQMGQLLLQVAGRAGREAKQGKVLIQTRHPEHELINILLQQGYHAFAEILLQEREQGQLPPFHYVALLRVESYRGQGALAFLDQIKEHCDRTGQVDLLGPVPALLAKKKGLYAQHLIFKADKRSDLQRFLQTTLEQIESLAKGKPVKWVLDVDPLGVL